MADTDVGNGGRAAPPEGGGATAAIPPYISFQTFLTFLSELKTNGVPPQIDNSVLKRFAGGIQGQLKSAVKSLGLVTLDGAKPTATLEALVDALETPMFEPQLMELLKANYPYVFALDLMTATPTMFADAFKVTGAKEEVARKCRTFFLYAAKKAGVQLGQRLTAGGAMRGSGNGGGKRKARAARPKDESTRDGDHSADQGRKDEPTNAFMDKLLDKFPAFDPTWPDEIKAKWFEGFDQFMKGAAPK